MSLAQKKTLLKLLWAREDMSTQLYPIIKYLAAYSWTLDTVANSMDEVVPYTPLYILYASATMTVQVCLHTP